jgi:hypothetical protein
MCSWKGKDIPIECKHNGVDWGQKKLELVDGKWKHNDEFVTTVLNNASLFNFTLPPPMCQDIMHQDWIQIKKNENTWDDVNFIIPDDYISKYYRDKGCYSIQINNKGLYHLGDDICNFCVPEVRVKTKLRVRTKVHSRTGKKGKFTQLSVMASYCPVNSTFASSPYSLDDILKLPPGLIYQ